MPGFRTEKRTSERHGKRKAESTENQEGQESGCRTEGNRRTITIKIMTKAVVFDMGGVIVKLDPQLCIANFKEKAGFDLIEDYLDRYHQKGFISDFEEGVIDEDGFYEECLRRSRPGTTRETIHECLCSLLCGIYEETVELIKELSGKYDLYILSNNNPITCAKFRGMLARMGVDNEKVFKKEFYSYKMRLLKPGHEIYDEVIKETGVKPEEMLFIDDYKPNVEGARAVGIPTIWLEQGTDIREEVMKTLKNLQ